MEEFEKVGHKKTNVHYENQLEIDDKYLSLFNQCYLLEQQLDYCYELLSHNPIRVGWQVQWKTKEKWKEFVDEKLSSTCED